MATGADQAAGRRGPPRLGIVGAGQLARMTYQAAISLGLTVRLLADRPDDSAALVGADVTLGAPRSARRLANFGAGCDVITFDHELVDASLLAALEQGGQVFRPGSDVAVLAREQAAAARNVAGERLPGPRFLPGAGGR